MKITRELLIKLKACQQGLDLLSKYPEGATLIELAHDPDVTLEDLFFARHYFNFNEEEIKLYNQKCEIVNCNPHILRSFKVKDSNWIYNSNTIENCNYVGNSEQIYNSNEITNSIDINSCENIANSKNIKYSTNVADSDNISSSQNIINSSYINWCNIINSCFLLNDCQFMYKSRNSKDCYFCGFVENSNHCIFCSNLSDAEFQIFNKQVTQEEFEKIKEILLFQLQNEDVNLMDINSKGHLENHFSYELRFDKMFEKLSDQFYGWVGSLPQYDEQLFLLLFFTALK